MPNTPGGASVREAVGSGLAHRLVHRASEFSERGTRTRKRKTYTTGAEEIGGNRHTGMHEAAARKAVKGAKMYREKLHGPAATRRVHKNRVAASRRAARKGSRRKAG